MCQAGPGRGPGIGRALGLLAKGGRHSAGLCAAPHRGSVRNTPRLLVGSLCGAAVLGELWAGGGCTVSRRPSSLGLVPAPVTGRGHLSSWAFQIDKWQCFPVVPAVCRLFSPWSRGRGAGRKWQRETETALGRVSFKWRLGWLAFRHREHSATAYRAGRHTEQGRSSLSRGKEGWLGYSTSLSALCYSMAPESQPSDMPAP